MADLRALSDKIVYIDSNGDTLYSFPNTAGNFNQTLSLDSNGNLSFRTQRLSDLLNVDASSNSPNVGQSLVWNGINWVADSLEAFNVLLRLIEEGTDSNTILELVNQDYIRSAVDQSYVQSIINQAYIESFIDQTYIQANQSTNATTLNGQNAAYYLDYNNFTNTPTEIPNDARGLISIVGVNTFDYMEVKTTAIDFFLDGNLDMRLENDGDLHVDGDVIAFSTTTSDIRLKEDVTTVENSIEKIKQLRGVEFTFKHSKKKSAGVIAQDVEKVLPQAVKLKTLLIDNSQKYKVVEYDQLHALLIEAVKDLQTQIDMLTSKIKEKR